VAFHKFMRAMSQDLPIDVYGDGHQTRDSTFIGDILDGLVAAPSAAPGTVLNLGGGSRVSLAQALDVLREVAGCAPKIRQVGVHAGDVEDTWASIDRARDEIGNSPTVSLHDGLAAEFAWFESSAASLYKAGGCD
jgi:UDP-glucose 4-epimerase